MANQMAKADLDLVFKALAHPARRAVVERLTDGAAPVSELAAPFDMALPSFLQHLDVLERSGLVRSEKAGRVRTYRMAQGPLEAAEGWLGVQRRQWEQRLDRFDAYVEGLAKQSAQGAGKTEKKKK
ncbi:MAG: metalloregulator ArsR/SmtB family transcription factor [Deltaproteobacteria bacterium]